MDNSGLFEAKLLLREKLIVGGIELYQPTILEIVREGGEDVISTYIGALSFTVDHIEEIDDDVRAKLKNFDVVFYSKDDKFKETVRNALKFFTNKPVFYRDEIEAITVGKTGLITRENYDEVVDAILKMHLRERVVPDRIKTQGMNNRQKKAYLNILKHRRDYASRHRFLLSDVMNIVKHGRESFLSTEELRKMTYFELYKAFEVLLSRDNYQEYLAFKTSANYKVEESVKHWTLSVKQSNNN